MWEWTNRIIKKKTPEKPTPDTSSLLTAYNDLIGSGYSLYHSRIRNMQIAENPNDEKISAPEPESVFAAVQQKISEFELPAMTRIVEKEYVPQSWQEMNNSFDRYYKLRGRFFKLLGYSDTDECRRAGLSEQDIDCLRRVDGDLPAQRHQASAMAATDSRTIAVTSIVFLGIVVISVMVILYLTSSESPPTTFSSPQR